MNAYKTVIDTLYDLLLADASINSVIKGDLNINKKDLFPLAHINIVSSSFDKATITFKVAVAAMNLRDTMKSTSKDKWTENDNENDNLDDMLYVQHRLYQKLLKLNDTLTLSTIDEITPFTEAHLDVADGWVMLFNVIVEETDSGIC